ncbi:MAG: hypothetical protein AAFQ63_11270 [Cyanobacteria bacterium J06621_11]
MPTLRGSQIGTAQSDSIEGIVQTSDIEISTAIAGISNATVNGLGGSDTIKGEVLLSPSTADFLVARGIDDSTIVDSGAEGDTFIGIGQVEGIAAPFNTSFSRAIGYGFDDGSLNGGAGNDVITFSGIGKAAKETEGYGIDNSTIVGGGGRDTISFSGLAESTPFSTISALAYGVKESEVSGQGNNDTIEIESTARAGSFRGSAQAVATAIGVRSGRIFGEKGEDVLRVTADGSGDRSVVTGADQSLLYSGAWDDQISVAAKSNGGDSGGVAVGIDNRTVVFGDVGADTIEISSDAFGGARGAAEGDSIGARSSSVFGGSGNDVISLAATASGSGGASAVGGFFARVDGDAGDDVINIDAIATAIGNVSVIGVSESDVIGGGGNDRIVITSTAQTPDDDASVGAQNSRIRGGSGDDYMKVVAEGSAAFDIQDVLLAGGNGNDTIDVGIGDGKIRGGPGEDVVVMNYFDASTMTITEINGGIRVSGTQSKSGSSSSWSQTILAVESFQIDDVAYTASDLIATLAG